MDRMIDLKLELDGVIINIISAYVLQQGCTLEEKEVFCSDLEETVEMISREERVIVGADLNGHVGVGNNGDEDVMGRHGMGERNDEGQAVVDFAKSGISNQQHSFRKNWDIRLCTAVEDIIHK